MDREISTVGIYVRKSREEETDDTLKRQEAVLTDYCKKNSWKYDIYREVGSSQDLDRPELQSMLTKIKSFHYDGIVIADLDRLSRNTGHFGTIKEIIINAGCLVITPSKTYDFTVQEDDLFSDIQSVLAKNEYQTIKKRLVRGARQSAKDGNWMGKKAPIGYKYNRDTKRLEPSDDELIIKRIFHDYLNGLSTTAIADKFTLEGVSTSIRMVWSSAGISRLLNNPVYYGASLYGKTKNVNGKRSVKTKKEEQIIVENTHEAIIDKETWDRVQSIKLQRNSRPLALKQGKHKFSGLIVCALCGRIHSFQHSKDKKKRITSCQTRHYKDNNFNNYVLCQNQGGNLDDFERYFFKELSIIADKLEDRIELIKRNTAPKNNNSEEKIKLFEKQLKKIEQDIKRVQHGFKMEIYTAEEAQSEIKGFKLQKEFIEREMRVLLEDSTKSSTDHLEIVLDKLRKFLKGHDDMPKSEANDILREFVVAVVYRKTEETGGKMKLQVIVKQ